jgi:hypothetical protein
MEQSQLPKGAGFFIYKTTFDRPCIYNTVLFTQQLQKSFLAKNFTNQKIFGFFDTPQVFTIHVPTII